MTAYRVKVQDFEGPLDLLIHLIEKDRIDIYDIPIVSVTEQYITYINGLKEYNIEIASEFLLMAATLLQIKSKILLPKTIVANDEEEAEDPRKMLVDMLVEYRKIKKRSWQLRSFLTEASKCVARKPMLFSKRRRPIKMMSLLDLLTSLSELLADDDLTVAVLPRQEFHVKDKMTAILQLLHGNNSALAFVRVVENVGNKVEKIAAFLAVLELLRLKKISIRQKEAFAPIYLFLREE